jgi:hypothetical protein
MSSPPQSKVPWVTNFWATFGVVLILFALVLFWYSRVPNGDCGAKFHAINNAKQISVALYSYAADHDGMYPNEQTASAELDEFGDTAEACFTQLLNAGKIDEEGSFWSKKNTVLGSVNAETPDEVGTLTAGENAWGYVRGLTTSSPTETPILFDSSKVAGEFSTQVWEGKAIVVKLNGSVKMMDISPADKPFGHIYEERDGKKMNLFKDLPDGAEILVPGLE